MECWVVDRPAASQIGSALAASIVFRLRYCGRTSQTAWLRPVSSQRTIGLSIEATTIPKEPLQAQHQ